MVWLMWVVCCGGAAFIERQTCTAVGTLRGGELMFKEDVMGTMCRSRGVRQRLLFCPFVTYNGRRDVWNK